MRLSLALALCALSGAAAFRVALSSGVIRPAMNHARNHGPLMSVGMPVPVPVVMPKVASATGHVLSGALVVSAALSSGWPAGAVRAGLASLTILDFRPTAFKQLSECQSAFAMLEATDMASRKRWRSRAGRSQVESWARLVSAKAMGECLGLCIALVAPCIGASVVLSSHLFFWKLGAADLRVDASAEPAPVPAQVARVISTADTVVLAFAALGVLGPTSALRKAGAALFAAAAAFVSAEQIPKLLRSLAARRAATGPEPEELPELTVKA